MRIRGQTWVQVCRHAGQTIEQLHTSESRSLFELPSPRKEKDQELLDEEGQKEYRNFLGPIGWLGNHSRPDLVYDHIAFSTKLGKATGADFAEAMRTGRKMIATPPQKWNSQLMSNWVMEVYGDAGFRSLPDKISSCGGQAVILRDSTTNHACVLNRKGRKLCRVNSSTAAKTLASNLQMKLSARSYFWSPSRPSFKSTHVVSGSSRPPDQIRQKPTQSQSRPFIKADQIRPNPTKAD